MSEAPPPFHIVERIPAAELYRIQEADVRRAIADFDSDSVSHEFAESMRFDLLVDGHERYPPSAIVGLAARESLGRVLSPADFGRGESSSAFGLLCERGFEIATKPRTVGSLDATFSVGRSRDGDFLIFESRGPDRNTDYMAGLDLLLYGLADLDATLLAATVDSTRTRQLPPEERQLVLPGHPFPVRLRQVVDLEILRRELTSSAALTGRSPEARGGGNPTKRVRLELGLSGELRLYELCEVLAENTAPSVGPPRQFRFQPSAPTQTSDVAARKAVDPTEVTHVHAQMQKALYDLLVTQYGIDGVAAEQMTCSGRPADLIVETPTGYEIYEIKTALSPRDCVRQALGQLLEYACWPGSPPYQRMWVVGPSEIDSRTEEYLSVLRRLFSLPVTYLRQRP